MRKHSRRYIYSSQNLSGVVLSKDETNLLSKGLSFWPTPDHLNSNQLLDDLENYFRRLRLKDCFKNEADRKEENLFRSPSTRMLPNGRDMTLEASVRGIRMEVQNQIKKLQRVRLRSNLSLSE